MSSATEALVGTAETPHGDPPTKTEDIHSTIAELAEHVGREVVGKFAVAEASVDVAKNGKPFAKFVLVDSTGSVNAKKWESSTLPETGVVIGVRADVDEWRGTTQLKLKGWKVLEDEPLADYVRSSPLPRHVLADGLIEELAVLSGPEGDVVNAILDREWRAFMRRPASKMYHHAYLHGLAEHTLSMLGAARAVCRHYNAMYGRDFVDENLVRCGVWLHDWAKIHDARLEGVAWVESETSQLVGHIPQCAAVIAEVGHEIEVAESVVIELQHLVLSHHGQFEYGSPVTPKTREAIVLHNIDMLDSKLAMHREATTGLDAGEWSSYCRPLGGEVRR